MVKIAELPFTASSGAVLYLPNGVECHLGTKHVE